MMWVGRKRTSLDERGEREPWLLGTLSRGFYTILKKLKWFLNKEESNYITQKCGQDVCVCICEGIDGKIL